MLSTLGSGCRVAPERTIQSQHPPSCFPGRGALADEEVHVLSTDSNAGREPSVFVKKCEEIAEQLRAMIIDRDKLLRGEFICKRCGTDAGKGE